MRRWYVIMWVVVVIFFGGVIGFNLFKNRMIASFLADRPEPIYPVTALTVKPSTWKPFITAIGFIKPSEGVHLANEQGGNIEQINFKSGEQVKKGALLVALDTSVEKGNLMSAEGQLPAVRARLERVKKLYREKGISKQELDKAEADFYQMEGQIASLKGLIKRRMIIAPFKGRVGIKNVYVGQYLPAGTDVVRLENTDMMHIQFTISQNDLASVKVGLPVYIFVGAYPKTSFEGAITAIEPAVDSESGVVDVQASIPNNNGRLRSGMYAKVEIKLPQEKNRIVIPQDAIDFQLYGQSVYVIREAKKKKGSVTGKIALQVPVKTAGYSHQYVLVESGLKAGDRIVTGGSIRLSNGSHVKIVEDKGLEVPGSVPQL